jgi:uncharacterized protein (TIGR03437 family)
MLTASIALGLLVYVAEPASPAVVPRIVISEGVVDVNRSVSLDITLAAAGQAITGVEFHLQYETGVSGISASAASAASEAQKQVWTAKLTPGVVHILVVGLNRNPIRDGSIATVRVQMKEAIQAGRYLLTPAAAVGVDTNSSVVVMEANGGAAIVPGEGVIAPAVRGVANAASYAGGAVAPGEIVVIGGSSLGAGTYNLQLDETGSAASTLGDTRVLFDGVPAPLVYTMPDQVSAIVPYAVSGQSRTSLQVERQRVRSAPVTLPVCQTSPAIFTLDWSGRGQGAIVNEDGSINGPGRPAGPGSLVLIYGTGEGQTSPPGIDGHVAGSTDLRRPLLPVSASIGSRSAEVLYAGSAGGQVAGLLQVNVRVPAGLATGDAVPVTLTVGSTSSQAGVTMAVR